jgi:hypothetical protein
MLVRAKEALVKGEFLNEFHPVPKNLMIVAGRVGDDNDPEQIKLQEQTMNNLSVYGYANWYDWCVNEWGTKWDVQDEGAEVQDGVLTTSFDSAWAPPTQAYGRLEDLGFEVCAHYYEPGMAFCGTYQDGLDDYYEIGGMKSGAVEAMLPEDLNRMFDISGEIANYEEEDADYE